LDIGCGIGDFVRMTQNVIGVDINPYNITYCKRKEIPAHNLEVDKLPFDNTFFDNVIEHIYDPEKIVNEAIGVTKIGRRVIIGVPIFQHFFHDKEHKVLYSTDFMKTQYVF
jgi:SAM-dependent methyltransferase